MSSGGGGPLGPALLVTPNPTADELVVDSEPTDEKDGSMELLLLNSNQEKVFHLAEARLPVSIPVSNLPEGTYYLMVITGKNKSVHRVLIEK
mgnify:CR=1 FL=1